MTARRRAVVITAVLAFSNPGATAAELDPGDQAPTCRGEAATIVGTAGDDELRGTPERDVIVAGRGLDVVAARGGDDVVCGGRGADTLLAGRGADRAVGGRGEDHVEGGRGSDVLSGLAGNDGLAGERGDDRLVGGRGSDSFDYGASAVSAGDDESFGGRGRDVHYATVGRDDVHGGPRSDAVSFAFSDVAVHVSLEDGRARHELGRVATRGIERVGGSARDDVLIGDDGRNVLLGGSGSDRVRGRARADDLSGGDGDDLVHGERGERDVTHGGAGTDRCESGRRIECET